MNISEQLDQINGLVRQSMCEHLSVTPLPIESKVKGFDHPITCDDCGKIIECDHEEIDRTEFVLPTCILCGAMGEDVVNMGGYDGR